MRLALLMLLVGCAGAHKRQRKEANIIGDIERSSVRVVSKRNAPDGSRSSGVIAYLKDDESPIAQAAAERYCGGPVIVRSEDYLATGDVKVDSSAGVFADAWGAAAFGSSDATNKRAWKLVFECNKAPTAIEATAYQEKFADTFVDPGIGDRVFRSLGL